MTRIWLQKIRKHKKLTHLQIATMVGIKRQYYGMIESGRGNPSVEVAKKIAGALEFEWTLFLNMEAMKRCMR
ncbi:helix-turn-helix transcriptional regulator [Paenibacillus sp. GSMTC-2017]|nr:helix-turn-helix transcriptional regulator [Paenibacillus sp. GSMTC-2017]MBH5316715.1 helix-turn-helix transcriptional regulator [Paenibacillus sp. GSMTC-2017]